MFEKPANSYGHELAAALLHYYRGGLPLPNAEYATKAA
jgi:hypothetical protein